MSVAAENPTTRLLVGDAGERLRELPAASAHCVVTSPPYWRLRDYGDAEGMVGQEATFGEHVERLVAIFEEVRRVLRPDGTLWLNYGDRYNPDRSKQLMMMPAQVALALQAAGWVLRSEVVWRKPNPMTESRQDRPTSAHEKVFLLSPSRVYFYDEFAVRTESDGWHGNRYNARAPERHAGENREVPPSEQPGGAQLRNVWSIASARYNGAHFATFPHGLVELPVLAGTSAYGCCAACGEPWRRIVGKAVVDEPPPRDSHQGRRQRFDPSSKARATRERRGWRPYKQDGHGSRYVGFNTRWAEGQHLVDVTEGWVEPSCRCDAGRAPCTVLDPFGGAGTAAIVANKLGRHAVLIEVNADYAAQAHARIVDELGLLARVDVDPALAP